MKRRQKAGFLRPGELQNHINEGKEKEKKKERGEEKKAMGALLVFIMATLTVVFGRKNCWTQTVHLAVTFSKVRLDILFITISWQ